MNKRRHDLNMVDLDFSDSEIDMDREMEHLNAFVHEPIAQKCLSTSM